MRVDKAIGVAVAVLVVTAMGAYWTQPVAADQQDVKKDVVQIQRALDAVTVGGGPRLGVSIRDVEKDDVAKWKLAGQTGVVIEDVTKDSAAAKAGVKATDVVVQYDGENVRSARQFRRLVTETVAGRTVRMAVMRDGKRVDLDVSPTETSDPMVTVFGDENGLRQLIEPKLEALRERKLETLREPRLPFRMERPEAGERFEFRALPPWTPGTPVPPASPYRFYGEGGGAGPMVWQAERGRLGVTVLELEPDLASYFGVKDGVLVSTVTPDSPAAKAGIKAGDVITTVNDKPVTSADELIAQLREKDGDVTIGVTRDKKAIGLKATLAAPPKPRRPIKGIGA